MKNIYEIPEVTIFEVGVCEQMIAGSLPMFGSTQASDNIDENNSEVLGNSNSMDDQSTPWYRR